MAWIVFLIVALPLTAFLVWMLLASSFVRIEPGKVGLLLIRGKATDTALPPGPHYVAALRRRMVQVYPSNELAYRAEIAEPVEQTDSDLERGGPPLQVMLGDRAKVELGYTLRFRLIHDSLRSIHERFSPDGIWAAVRDVSGRTIRTTVTRARWSVDDLFGEAREGLQSDIAAALTEALAADGFEVTLFSLGDIDLGRSGDVIQATVRARLELAREEAEAATRLARARIDAELEPYLAGLSADGALRYREVDAWHELAQSHQYKGNVVIPPPSRSGNTAVSNDADQSSEPGLL